jgi:hypothetical protein
MFAKLMVMHTPGHTTWKHKPSDHQVGGSPATVREEPLGRRELREKAALWLEENLSPSMLFYLQRVYPKDTIVRLLRQRKSRAAVKESR